MRALWRAHRTLVRRTDGRRGLSAPREGGRGVLRLTTTGRRSGEPRQVILGYLEDDAGLVVMAMNGGAAAEPAWWLNLQAEPHAEVQTADGTRLVRARRADGAERERLWARWTEIDTSLDVFAARRPGETAVVVLETVAEHED
jgi:F420H(2)-dependent quinone reductase